jgi:anti-sigma B factor antagonist
VLLAPRPEVREVITTTGIDDLIPIFHDEAEAIAAVI